MNQDLDYITRIKELKKERGINTNELAELSGVPVGTLTKILSAVSDSVKLSNICAICKALNTSLDYVIFGIPENTNNYTLSEEEMDMIEDYRRLDANGTDFVNAAIRMARGFNSPAPLSVESRDENLGRLKAKVLSAPNTSRSYEGDAVRRERRHIELYDLRVSAGSGQAFDDSVSSETISIPVSPLMDRADYAVKISGDSMEPKYHNGDMLLVERTENVEVGEPCIFTLDGSSYFKIFGGDCLIPLNTEYPRIILKEFDNVFCCGRVLGRLKKSVTR